jgi:hypothetical protein
MHTGPLYLFRRECDNLYALSDRRWCRRRLPAPSNDWTFSHRIVASEFGAAYFAAAKLVADQGICIWKLKPTESGIVFECCCPSGTTIPEQSRAGGGLDGVLEDH